jgi:hypothetical protein
MWPNLWWDKVKLFSYYGNMLCGRLAQPSEYPEYGCSIFLWNLGSLLPDYPLVSTD